MDVARTVAAAIPETGRPVLVAIDGVDGAGKTTFANGLAKILDESGTSAIVVHEDDFLNPRSIRYRLGRNSPEGYFSDSYDLDALTAHVLSPLANDGDRKIVRKVFDHRSDTAVSKAAVDVPGDAVVIVEGMFLHRDELIESWDLSVFLDVPFAETARRMAERDGSHPDPEHPSMHRYIEGQRLYLAQCRPHERATIIVDNVDPRRPRIIPRHVLDPSASPSSPL